MFSPIPDDDMALVETTDENTESYASRRSIKSAVQQMPGFGGAKGNIFVRGITSMIAISGVVIAIGIMTRRPERGTEWTPGEDVVLDKNESIQANTTSSGQKLMHSKSVHAAKVVEVKIKNTTSGTTPPGCCSWAPYAECGEVLGDCKGGLKECEMCKGQWISLNRTTCEQGHTLENPLPQIWNYSAYSEKHATIKVLSYNLYWWYLYDKTHQNWKPAKLVNDNAKSAPFDVMGLQECNWAPQLLIDAGLSKQYVTFHTDDNNCIAVLNHTWEVLAHGHEVVANDAGKQDFGQRTGAWVRIRHRETQQTVFFLNHHGPLPLSSGGLWGGPTTARKLLNLIIRNATKDDAAILVGDFNSDAHSLTVEQLGCSLRRVISGNVFGGLDHIFSNIDESKIISRKLLGKGGSDHDALSAVFKLEPSPNFVNQRVLQQEAFLSWKK